MAAAGDGGIIGRAAAATGRRTIYDYLGEGEDGAVASPPSPETPPPRLLRFTCARFRFGSRLCRKRGGQRKEADKSEDASSADSSSGRRDQAAGDSGGGGGSAVAGHTAGMGLTMLLLLVRTCAELNRMAEVRAQMEALLQEIRDEAGRVKSAADHDVIVVAPPKACGDLQSSSSCVSDTSTSITNRLELARGEDEERAASGDAWRAGSRTDVLELEEVEAGLETTEPARRRRQPPPECECGAEEGTPECSVQSSSDDEFIELAGGRFGTGGSSSQSQRCVDVDDDSDDGDGSGERRREGGVPAAELERRLHELRHRRDRERIEALEAALRRAQQKLTEKEMEARLWQDTAAMALGRPAPRDPDGHGQ